MAPTPWSACCSSMASSTSSACAATPACPSTRSEEHTSELQSRSDLVCRLLLEKKKKITHTDSTRLEPSHEHRTQEKGRPAQHQSFTLSFRREPQRNLTQSAPFDRRRHTFLTDNITLL